MNLVIALGAIGVDTDRFVGILIGETFLLFISPPTTTLARPVKCSVCIKCDQCPCKVRALGLPPRGLDQLWGLEQRFAKRRAFSVALLGASQNK